MRGMELCLLCGEKLTTQSKKEWFKWILKSLWRRRRLV